MAANDLMPDYEYDDDLEESKQNQAGGK